MVISPKLVALDTSHWAKLISNANSPDRNVRHAALQFLPQLLQSGCTVLFSWHHLQELLAIDDKILIAQRIQFITKIPFLSWVCDVEDGKLGGITDITAVEALASYNGAKDVLAVRKAAKTTLIRSGCGRDMLPSDPTFLLLLNIWAQQRSMQARTVTAISPVSFANPKQTIGEFLTGKFRSHEDSSQTLLSQQRALTEEISTYGDRRIKNPSELAFNFMREVIDTAVADMPSSVQKFIAQRCAALGIDEDEIDTSMSMEEFDRLAHYRSQLRVVADKTRIPFDVLKRRIRPEQMPHRVIGNALRKHGQKLEERKGSDLNHVYLAVLAAYADVLYVDKRTAENFRRAATKESELRPLIGRIEKASDYRSALIPDARHHMSSASRQE